MALILSDASSRVSLLVIVAVASVIAVIAPFDVAFARLTLGSPVLRVLLIAAMAVTGAACADTVGYRLQGHGSRHYGAIGVAAAVGVAIGVIVFDAWLCRSLLSHSYVEAIRAPLAWRLSYFMLRAFYRLFVFSTLSFGLLRMSGARSPNLVLVLIAAVATQVLNIGMNVVALSDMPISLGLIGYDIVRYIAPGVLWALLFWRFGFVVAEIASVGCHLFLQPVLGLLL
jgi:hypothetical protein